MSLELKKKDVLANYETFKICYCDLQFLLNYEHKIGYTYGVYGWNCDVYLFEIKNRIIAISTGYRPFGIETDYKVVKEYEQKARNIQDSNIDYSKKKAKIKKLLNKFLEKLLQSIQ